MIGKPWDVLRTLRAPQEEVECVLAIQNHTLPRRSFFRRGARKQGFGRVRSGYGSVAHWLKGCREEFGVHDLNLLRMQALRAKYDFRVVVLSRTHTDVTEHMISRSEYWRQQSSFYCAFSTAIVRY